MLVTLEPDIGGLIEIAVSDNGKGFPVEDRNRLTEPYVTTRAEGTGLGLPIVVKIFEDHGGGVDLLDGLERGDGGRGAMVLMKMPMSGAADTADATRTPDLRITLMAADILIVDDEEDIRELVAGILEDEGHQPRSARNSDEALAAIESRRPQLILLDIWLQGSKLDGLQLLEAIKKQNPPACRW